MSIDAVIDRIERRDDETVLHLVSRMTPDGADSIAGQLRLTVEGQDHFARFGCAIWGGASAVSLVRPGLPEVEYKRIGYCRLSPGVEKREATR